MYPPAPPPPPPPPGIDRLVATSHDLWRWLLFNALGVAPTVVHGMLGGGGLLLLVAATGVRPPDAPLSISPRAARSRQPTRGVCLAPRAGILLDALRVLSALQLLVSPEAHTLHAFLYLATFGVVGALVTALAAVVTDKTVQAKAQQMTASLLAPLRKGERTGSDGGSRVSLGTPMM